MREPRLTTFVPSLYSFVPTMRKKSRLPVGCYNEKGQAIELLTRSVSRGKRHRPSLCGFVALLKSSLIQFPSPLSWLSEGHCAQQKYIAHRHCAAHPVHQRLTTSNALLAAVHHCSLLSLDSPRQSGLRWVSLTQRLILSLNLMF